MDFFYILPNIVLSHKPIQFCLCNPTNWLKSPWHFVSGTTDKYRLIVLTDNNINISSSILSDYDWGNADLIFVNLGNGNFNSEVVGLATNTGGTTYNTIYADDLITEIGEFVNIPEEYIGADSDGDGLPDLVEQYGLKPNGDSIDTNPYESDTDGDGVRGENFGIKL